MSTVEQLLKLWQDEGFRTALLAAEDEPTNLKLRWELWMVTSNNTYYDDYGRHGVIRVLFEKEGRKIVKDELFNARVRMGENLYNIPVRNEEMLVGR